MDQEHIAQCINTLGIFCGRRDVSSLTSQALRKSAFNQVGGQQPKISSGVEKIPITLVRLQISLFSLFSIFVLDSFQASNVNER